MYTDYEITTEAGVYCVTLEVTADTVSLWEMTDDRGRPVDLSGLFMADRQDPAKMVSFMDVVADQAIDLFYQDGGYREMVAGNRADRAHDLAREVA